LTALEQLEKELLMIEFPGTVLIGVSEGGSAGRGDPEMPQFPLVASQAPGDLPKGMSSAELAEEHGHKLAPAGEPSSMTFGLRLFHGLLKFDSRKEL